MQESIVFFLRVQFRRKESSRSLSRVLMSFLLYLEIRSVERAGCRCHSQVHNDQTVPIIMTGCIAYARNGHISTSGLYMRYLLLTNSFLLLGGSYTCASVGQNRSRNANRESANSQIHCQTDRHKTIFSALQNADAV